MPNWCEGSIKVRGKRDKVKNFLINGVNRYYWNIETRTSEIVPKDDVVFVKEDEWGATEIEVRDAYIEGTRRAFIDNLYAYLDDEDVCVAGHFRQAWCIDGVDFDKLKDKWDVDFRLYGIERGMEFAQEVIAERGKELEDETFKYGDFIWECPFPYMGG